MRIINATPHAIALIGRDGLTRIIENTRPPARIETAHGEEVGEIETIPIFSAPRFLRIANLPEWQPDVVVVVSQLVALAAAVLHPGRCDLLYPATGPADGAKRTPKGVLAVRRLIRVT